MTVIADLCYQIEISLHPSLLVENGTPVASGPELPRGCPQCRVSGGGTGEKTQAIGLGRSEFNFYFCCVSPVKSPNISEPRFFSSLIQVEDPLSKALETDGVSDFRGFFFLLFCFDLIFVFLGFFWGGSFLFLDSRMFVQTLSTVSILI